MTAIFCDWNMPASTGQVSRHDAPVPAERLHRVGADRAVAAEWNGPKPLPPMGPHLDWTVARPPERGGPWRD